MATQTDPIVDEQLVPWLRGLLGSCKELEAQTDAHWRHAYGIAQGTGFTLKNRNWPPFPTTSGSSFMKLVAAEKVRRDRGSTKPTGASTDPFNPQQAPDLSSASLPQAGAAQEKQAEQLIKGLLKQAKLLGRSDPCWRHAYGIAQGFGAMRRTTEWPPFPTQPGSQFLQLVDQDETRRKSAPQRPAGPPLGGPPRQKPAAPHLAAATMLEGDTDDAPAAPRPPARRPMMGNFKKPGAGTPPGRPQIPRPPRAPQPPQPPGAPGGQGFRAMPTMMDAGGDDPTTNAGAGAGGGAGQGFRAMPTMMDAGSDSGPADPGGEGFRAMPTMMDAGSDAGPAPGGEGFRAMPTMMDAGSDAGPAPGGEGFRAMPTMMDAGGGGGAPAAAPAQQRPTGRRGPSLGGMRAQLSGGQAAAAQRKQDQKKRAAKAEQIEKIGSFEILSKLGKGAMGQVFKGRGTSGEVVAIKVLHQRFGKSKRVKARFMREAKAVERIEHPGVVRFFETGEQEGVGQYIAMEFVDGLPMHDMLKKRRGKAFEINTALDYFVQSAKGMRAAHAAGVIHRDLKPENVLVSRQGEVKITDFSLARRDEDSMLLTRPGQVMGTPHFMSPEQAKGEPVDGRTDIYSLGAMLYVMLTGSFPFPTGSVSEVIAAHCESPRPDPRDLNKEVSADLAELTMRLMSIDRKSRPQTMDALLDELNQKYGFEKEDQEEVIVAGSLPPGTQVDEFTIQKVLGAGGMGAVYKASHTSGPVALKVLPHQPGRAPQERVKDVRRFHNEAKIAKRVKSENVYDIVKFGVDQNGQAFIAMGLADGISLKDLIQKRGFLSPALIIHVARGTSKALQAIKAAGFVHRDITPANIMLRGDFHEADDANVCLIDFGLAIPLEKEKKKNYLQGGIQLSHIAKSAGGGEEDLELDEDELFLEELPGGTPAYMAPEVLEDPSLVDQRADLYGLGATLYHAATGHPPYTGDSIQQVIYQQRSSAPASIKKFNADFPDELEEIILQLLSTHPNGRPRSAKLILSKLQRMEDPNAVQSWRPGAASGGQAQIEIHEVIINKFRAQDFVLGFMVAVLVMGAGALLLPQFGIKLPPALLELLGAPPAGG